MKRIGLGSARGEMDRARLIIRDGNQQKWASITLGVNEERRFITPYNHGVNVSSMFTSNSEDGARLSSMFQISTLDDLYNV